MRKPGYCTQNDGDCPSCSLANYGRDCVNNKIYTLGEIAKEIAYGDLKAMTILLNDAGIDPKLDELEPDSGEFIPRPVLIDLATIRAGDRVGRMAGKLLDD